MESLPHVSNPAEFQDYWDGHHELLLKFGEHIGVATAPGSSPDFIPESIDEYRKAVNDFIGAIRIGDSNLPDVIEKMIGVAERVNLLVSNYPIVLQIAREHELSKLGRAQHENDEIGIITTARRESSNDLVTVKKGPIHVRARESEVAIVKADTALHEERNRSTVGHSDANKFR